ncbi:MAG: O-antigen ligase family protein [Nitrospirota bacterium]
MDRRNQPNTKIVYIISPILIFSVLSFGSVEIWSSAIVQVSVLTLFVAWPVFPFANGQPDPAPSQKSKVRRLMFITLGCLLAFMALQMFPLPPVLLNYISPKAFEIYSFYLPEGTPDMYISLHSYRTRTEFFRILSYAAFFVTVAFSFKERPTIELQLKVLAWFGFILAVFAIIQKATWTGKLYWLRELTHGGTPFGPFVNRNHYAGLIGMLIPLSLGLAFTRRDRAKQFLFGFLALIMAVSLFLSLSRGGIISFFGGITVFAFFLSWRRFRKRKIWGLAAFVFLLFLYLIYLGIDPLIDRFYSTDLTREDRFTVWSETLRASRDFLIVGSGLGTFINVFPLYSSDSTASIYDHAHNDYLEFILEAGIIGSVLLVLALFFYFCIVFRAGWKGRAGVLKASMISAIGTISIHSIFDFNLHIMSNALMLMAICGMAFALSSSGSDGSREAVHLA